ITRLVIGIGLNVNMLDDVNNIVNSSWTSLAKITNSYHNRNHLLAVLIKHLISGLKKFSNEGFQPFFLNWNKYDLINKKRINVILNKDEIEGMAEGINKQGHLALRLLNGELKYYTSGDVSVRF
ncbi:MAG: biotin--[acetyl-CoA-carboxylase] ligase, partial [Gammaproteobacteria bacterium]